MFAKLLELVTGRKRYRPTIEWSSKSWVHNFFRAFEYLFGREYGIRVESEINARTINGKKTVTYKFYTLEATLAHIETTIRNFKPGISFEWVELPSLQLANGPVHPVHLPHIRFAIAYDAVSNRYKGTNGTSDTNSHTTTGSDRMLTVMLAGGAITNGTQAVTYNSVSMTNNGAATSSGQPAIPFFYLVGPSTGANTISASWSGSSDDQIFGISYTGVSQTSPINASDTTQTNTSTSITATLTTTVNDCWLWSFFRNTTAGDMSAGTGTTKRSTGSTYGGGGDSNGSVGTAGSGKSMQWTSGSSAVNYGNIVAIAPTGGGGGVTTSRFLSSLGVG